MGLSLVCAAPLLLGYLGWDLGTEGRALTPASLSGLDPSQLQQAAHAALRGSYTHIVLEWTGVCAALLVCMLTAFAFRRTRRPEMPIIGLAMICAASMAAFQTFLREPDNLAVSAFTWALCRLFNGLILFCGLTFAALYARETWSAGPRTTLAGIGLGLVFAAYMIVRHCGGSSSVPATVFPDALIKRPYDLYPLVPFLASAVLLIFVYLPRQPSPFGRAILLSLIPAVATQLYMAFGSETLHDAAFNVAHGLKALSYIVPVFGVLYEHERTYDALEDQGKWLSILNEELQQSSEIARQQAMHDRLTRLPDRSLFEEQVARAIAHGSRHGHRVAVLFLDLDGFKEVNDTLGHEAGDDLLITVARRLEANVRASDVVSRLGGDEFTVLLMHVEQREDAAVVARKLIDEISVPHEHRGHELEVTPSIGVALYPGDGEKAEHLLRAADLAMYAAKQRGGRAFEYFDKAMDKSAHDFVVLRSELRRALERGEFVLYYQPQVRLDRAELVGAEALVRWMHPQRGLVPPGQFLQVAEQTGLVIELGRWVLCEALAQQRRWSESLGALRMGVNVSFRQVRDMDFPRLALDTIEEVGVDPGRVDLELTESWIVEDLDRTLAHLDPLKRLGVRLSIDDFGTGYSTLQSLEQLPIDALKIDRAFLRDSDTNRAHRAITKAILTMAEGLDLDVVGEGIETEAELAALRELGLKEAQGYLFSRPLPAEEFEDWAGDWEIAKA